MAETSRDLAHRLSEGCAVNNNVAVRHLARSAALEELVALHESKPDANDVHSDGAVMIWFVVRTLCHEFGFNVNEVVASARRYAQQVEQNNVNVI